MSGRRFVAVVNEHGIHDIVDFQFSYFLRLFAAEKSSPEFHASGDDGACG
jgi:hypothetical protein